MENSRYPSLRYQDFTVIRPMPQAVGGNWVPAADSAVSTGCFPCLKVLQTNRFCVQVFPYYSSFMSPYLFDKATPLPFGIKKGSYTFILGHKH